MRLDAYSRVNPASIDHLKAVTGSIFLSHIGLFLFIQYMPPKAIPTESTSSLNHPRGGRGGNRSGNNNLVRGRGNHGEGRGRGAPSMGHAADRSRHHGSEPGRRDDSSRGGGGGGRGRGRGRGYGSMQLSGLPPIEAPHVIGPAVVCATLTANNVHSDILKRPGFGQLSDRKLDVLANVYEVNIPRKIINHYDVITPEAESVAMNIKVIKHLCHNVAPEIFMPRTSANPDISRPAPAFDGRHNMFATWDVDFRLEDPSQPATWVFTLHSPRPNARRPPKLYTVVIKKVDEIDPQILQEFVAGKQSPINEVSTAIMAINIAIRMDVISKYIVNSHSFFVPDGKKDIGGGVELWRGYFQSVRPAMGRMLINIDITTAMMYRAGPLIDTCLSFFDIPPGNPLFLVPNSQDFGNRQIRHLSKFLANLQVKTIHNNRTRRIKGLTERGANDIMFDFNDRQISIAEYFHQVDNRPLEYSNLICIKTETGALIPLELCEVPEGQIMKKELYQDKTRQMLDFSRVTPPQRFEAIRNGLKIMAFHESPTIKDFGFSLRSSKPLTVPARILPTPDVLYNYKSKLGIAKPENGAWNVVDRIFYRPAQIRKWVIMIYESRLYFNETHVTKMITDLSGAARKRGMTFLMPDPVVKWADGQGNVAEQLKDAGFECLGREPLVGEGPNLIVVILPNQAGDIYTAIKHFGDVTQGVPTQCLQARKTKFANDQFWNNVLLKINPKIGGINSILNPTTNAAPFLGEDTIVMGADVMHPPPRSEGIPSYASVVGSVDAHSSYYVATTQAQEARSESILDLKGLCTKIINKYMDYHVNVEGKDSEFLGPQRLIFFRDGVSEGEFAMVKNHELTEIRDACNETGVNPHITLVVVGKRHHYRFCPSKKDADLTDNCPAGMVIDQTITHPVYFDYFLQSQGGLIGTSRPAHYTIIHDENNFAVDSIQQLSFALCHVYARATRSVSIPAPIYYAHLVCQRAKNHYKPKIIGSDSASEVPSGLSAFQEAFKPLHERQTRNMYYM